MKTENERRIRSNDREYNSTFHYAVSSDISAKLFHTNLCQHSV